MAVAGLVGVVALALSLTGCATQLLGVTSIMSKEPPSRTDGPQAKKQPETTAEGPNKGPRADDIALASDDDAPSASDEMRIQIDEPVLASVPDTLGDGPVSLLRVLDYARANHPTLRVKAQEIDLARAERVGASLVANPQLVMDADGPVDGDNPTSLSTRIDFTIPMGDKRQRAMSAASAAEERARQELAYETDLVLLEVSDAATTVLYLQELAEQQQQLSDLNARFAKMQDERAARNVITDVDRLLADTSAKEAEFERLRTLADLEQARLALAQAMGMREPRSIALSDHLQATPSPPIPLQRLFAEVRRVRPEFRAGDWGIREQQRRVTAARAMALPDIRISPRYRESFDDPDDQMGGRFATDLMLWNWNQGEIAEALAGTRQAQANLQVYENTTFGEVAQRYVLLAPLERQLAYYDQQVEPAMQEAIASIEKAFAVQAIDAAELAQQLTRLAKLRREHLELRYLHQQNRMRLEILLRRPLASFAAEPIPPGTPLPIEQTAPLPLP